MNSFIFFRHSSNENSANCPSIARLYFSVKLILMTYMDLELIDVARSNHVIPLVGHGSELHYITIARIGDCPNSNMIWTHGQPI